MFPLTVVVLELYYLGLVFVLCVLLPLSCIILCCCLRVVLYRGGPLFPLIFVVFELYYIWVCFLFVRLPLSCIILCCCLRVVLYLGLFFVRPVAFVMYYSMLLSSSCIISGFVFCSSGCLCHVLFYVVVFELYYIWVCLLFVRLPLSCIILCCCLRVVLYLGLFVVRPVAFVMYYSMLLSSSCIISGFVFCSSGCLCHVLFYVVVLELYYIWVCLLFVRLPLSCIILCCCLRVVLYLGLFVVRLVAFVMYYSMLLS